MRKFAADRNYQCRRPVLVVVGGNPDGTWHMSVIVLDRHAATFLVPKDGLTGEPRAEDH